MKTYYHEACPEGHPAPWWFNAMGEMWYWVAQLSSRDAQREDTLFAKMAKADEAMCPRIVATGGNEPRKLIRW